MQAQELKAHCSEVGRIRTGSERVRSHNAAVGKDGGVAEGAEGGIGGKCAFKLLRQMCFQVLAPMVSTGVYWIAPHEVLERYSFEMVLVNTRELANVLSTLAPRVPGRKKTDRVDCQWIQRLHSCGLLTGSFRPQEQVCMLRTLVRDKKTNVLSNSCTGGLVAPDAEKPGPAVQELKAHYECTGASGRIGYRRRDRHGHHARNRNALSTLAPSGRARRPAIGEVAECALLEERGGNRRTIEWALA